MATIPKSYITPEEYLEVRPQGGAKSEYFAGEMFAMAGAREPHVLIVGNVAGELRQQVRTRPCRVYGSEMRVPVSATGMYVYPDVIVVCGEPQFLDERRDTLLNPTPLVEVLSESTGERER